MRRSLSSGSTSSPRPIDPKREQLFALVESRQDIDGRFTDIHRLGQGAFSLVFSALDTQTNKRVAVKVLDPYVHDGYRRACFEREEALLRPLAGHRNVINWVAPRSQFIQVLNAPNGFQFDLAFDYYALELARRDVGIATNSRSMTPARLLTVFNEMCRGVQRIHAANMAHRDLKPSNFLIRADGTTCVTDLGTARRFSDGHDQLLPSYTGPPGDIAYCAPEMLACLHDVDPTIAICGDMYSLGASLFEMFSGAVLNLQVMDQAFFSGLALVAQVARAERNGYTTSCCLKSLVGRFRASSILVGPRPSPSQVKWIACVGTWRTSTTDAASRTSTPSSGGFKSAGSYFGMTPTHQLANASRIRSERLGSAAWSGAPHDRIGGFPGSDGRGSTR